MNDPWNWNYKDLEKLIGQMESIRLDFKQSLLFEETRDHIARNLSKVVSAFANTEGGLIIIGISERQEGKARIADKIDTGVDIRDWSPEQIQQIIESNVSPYLTGLRINPIAIDKSGSKNVYVIYVPQGSTAYQAKDYHYYGRSEYESKALPDHEIRLRMFRGKTPSAIVQVVSCHIAKKTVSYADIIQQLPKLFDDSKKKLNERKPEDKIPLREYQFGIAVTNTGEVNISEFKIKGEFSQGSQFKETPFALTYKDGWRDPRILFFDGDPQKSLLHLTIYPQDSFNVRTFEFHILDLENLSEKKVMFDWKLYLSNTQPINGRIDVVEEFKSQGLI